MNVAPIADKFRAFGWYALEIDGHDMSAIINALDRAETVKGQPTVLVAKTVKGKGISFMENNNDFHGKAPTPAQLEQALKELEAAHV